MLAFPREAPYESPMLFPRGPRLPQVVRLTPDDFAAAVARLEATLGAAPDERAIAEELAWPHSRPALVSLGQEARAAGLVRMRYDDAAGGRRRYAHI